MATYMNQTNSGRIIVQQTSPSAIIVQPDNERKIILKGSGGLKGETGEQGPAGEAATIAVGTTSTLAPGASATVTNSGTSSAAVLDFGIPKGEKGDTGAAGADGYSPSATVSKSGDTATISITDKDGTTTTTITDGVDGAAATIAAGTTTTLAPGSSATVTNTGTSSAAVFDFGIPEGQKGDAATIAVGTTSTLSPGSSATVTNSGTSSDAVFNFGIPKGETGATGPANTLSIGTVTKGDTADATITGDAPNQTLNLTLPKGDKGDTGSQGPQGPAATITAGTTSTLPAGSSATVTNSGTSSAAVFNFGIPKGDKGDTGETGATGATGPAGPGVVTGGTTGQVLAKKSNTNYDTEWITQTSANDATLTITQNGTSKGTFTANSAVDTTIALTDTTYSDFGGATSSVAGSHGLVPAPTTSDPDKFLKGDGTWGTPPGTTYTAGNGIEINGSTISAKVREVYNHYTSRPTTANTTPTGNGGMYTFQATSSMTTGKPKNDSHILHLEWDNTSGFDSQIALSSWDSAHWLGYRAQSNGTWGSWVYLLNDEAGSVKTTNIDALAVTTAKIADGAITEAKMDATDWAKKVNVASIDLTGQTTTLLSLAKTLGTNGVNYARWMSRTDGGSSNISDKPTGGTNKSFVCEAIASRWAANNDYGYQLICRSGSDTNPYVAYIDQNSASITWSRLRPTVNDATLTITQSGNTLGTFTANASSNVTIDVPTSAGPKGDPGKGCPIGTILPYTSSTMPEGYLLCDGSAVSRATYADLFDVIGTTYGAGDGSTTFNLPNLKGKVPVGQDTSDTSFDTLGETGGEKTHTLVNNELPKIDAYWQFHGTEHGTNVYNLKGSNVIGTKINNKYQAISGASGAYSYSDVGIRFGNNEAHNNLQPYTVLVYIIKWKDLAATVAEVKNAYSSSQDDVYSANYVNSAIDAFHSGNYVDFNFGAFTVTNQERVLGTHTCTVAGTYLIIMSLSFDLSGGGYVVRKCYKNDTMVAADTPNIINQTSSSRMGGTFATVQTLAVGDVVKMTYQGYTSGSAVASNKPNNGWAMIRII